MVQFNLDIFFFLVEERKCFVVSDVVIMELSLASLSSFVSLHSHFLPQVWEGNALQPQHNALVLHSMQERSENLFMVVAWQYPFSPYITHPYDFTPAFSQHLIYVTATLKRHFAS